MRKIPAIDPRKHHQGKSDEGKPSELSEELQDGFPEATPYVVYGAYPMMLFLFLLLVAAIAAFRIIL